MVTLLLAEVALATTLTLTHWTQSPAVDGHKVADCTPQDEVRLKPNPASRAPLGLASTSATQRPVWGSNLASLSLPSLAEHIGHGVREPRVRCCRLG